MVVEFFHNLLLNLAVWFLLHKEKPRFRKWTELEIQKNKILKAVEESSDDFPDHLLAYLSTALHLSSKFFRKASWENIVGAFYKTIKITQCQIDLPIFSPSGNKEKSEAWDYETREWHVYVHTLAKNYGWSIEYISNLKIEDALAKVQEILIEEQLTKEFQWDMSDRSSYYDTISKTAKFVPLPRPNWMSKHIDPRKELRLTNIPKDMLPLGQGINQNDLIAQASIS